MMAISIVDRLQELRPHSNTRLLNGVYSDIGRSVQRSGGRPLQLVKPKMIANANWTKVPIKDNRALLESANRQFIRKVLTLESGFESSLTYKLNTALLGGQSYPVLTAVLGTAAGMASFGAGLLFTVATTGLSVTQKSQRILARGGDEIWQVEEIGKIRDGSDYTVTHINSYFLVDPYRKQNLAKGWLIHEERSLVTLN